MRGPDKVTMKKLPQTPLAKNVIKYAIKESKELNHNYIGTEHLLLGLIREENGVASIVLKNFGLTLKKVREEIRDLFEKDDIHGLFFNRWSS